MLCCFALDMRSLLLLLALAAAASAAGTQWALLIAGSSTYANYRHQSDIYHAYQLMLQGGISKDNIIVMHYDDIANSPSNPQKGNVINRPDGPNNYVDVPKDYVGSNVTAANFLRALKGVAVPPQVTCPNEGYTAGQSCDQVMRVAAKAKAAAAAAKAKAAAAARLGVSSPSHSHPGHHVLLH
jgi:hypothetical protein